MRGGVLVPILALAALPALVGCGSPRDGGLPPVSDEALAAVTDRAGAPRRQLARATDALFAGGAGDTRALVVMHAGAVAAERYGPGYGPQTRFLGWSMAKSVTGVLIGLLVADGRLALDERVPIDRWQRPGDPRGAITLRQLLQMRSGLRHEEAGEPVYESSEVRMLFLDGRDDMARWAEDQPLEARPGARFEYSTATAVILADIAARVLAPGGSPATRRAAVDGYLHEHLFGPVGMDGAVAEYDRAGTLVGGSLIHATARDWARFGELLRNKGSVAGAQIVPRQWIDFMMRPNPRAADYGAQLWIDAPAGDGEGGGKGDGAGRHVLFDGEGAPGTVAAAGHLGQYVVVSPRQKLTIVRLGRSTGDEPARLREGLAEIAALYPAD